MEGRADMKDTFVSDLKFTLAAIVKIILCIVLKVQGILTMEIWLVVVSCILIFFVPMGATILFVIGKLVGILSLDWIWILVAIALDLPSLNLILSEVKK